MRRRDPMTVTQALLDQVLAEAGLRRDDSTTSPPPARARSSTFRTGHFYGMTTHARGGLFLDPDARAVIDIGALHARAMLIDERAKVLGYRMTSQCASGSGQFLENICRYLGVTIDEIGPLSLQADEPETCSSICAVLAETDVINMVSRGICTPNILKGIHLSMAGRLLAPAHLRARPGGGAGHRRAGAGRRPRGRDAGDRGGAGRGDRHPCASGLGPGRGPGRGAVGRLPRAQAGRRRGAPSGRGPTG